MLNNTRTMLYIVALLFVAIPGTLRAATLTALANCNPQKTLTQGTTLFYDQGQCQSAWALALAAAISDSHCRFHIH